MPPSDELTIEEGGVGGPSSSSSGQSLKEPSMRTEPSGIGIENEPFAPTLTVDDPVAVPSAPENVTRQHLFAMIAPPSTFATGSPSDPTSTSSEIPPLSNGKVVSPLSRKFKPQPTAIAPRTAAATSRRDLVPIGLSIMSCGRLFPLVLPFASIEKLDPSVRRRSRVTCKPSRDRPAIYPRPRTLKPPSRSFAPPVSPVPPAARGLTDGELPA